MAAAPHTKNCTTVWKLTDERQKKAARTNAAMDTNFIIFVSIGKPSLSDRYRKQIGANKKGRTRRPCLSALTPLRRSRSCETSSGQPQGYVLYERPQLTGPKSSALLGRYWGC